MSLQGLSLSTHETEILTQPNTMNDICANILQGGSLLDLAETWKIPFGRIRLWMADDEDRDKSYIKALNMRAELESERIKRELTRISYADFRQIYTKEGNLKPFTEWPNEVAAAVSGLEYDAKGNLIDFKKLDKLRSLELLGKSIAMFNEKLTVDGNMNLEQMLVLVDKQARAMMSQQASQVTIEQEASK